MRLPRSFTSLLGVLGITMCVAAKAQELTDARRLARGLGAIEAVAGGKGTMADRLDAAYTTGYITASLDAVLSLRVACVPNLSPIQQIDVVRSHLASNRDAWTEPAFQIILQAYRNRFPCN